MLLILVWWLRDVRPWGPQWAAGTLAGSAFVGARLMLSQAASNLDEPPVWDFLAFYLYGKVAFAGGSAYDPDVFRSVFSTLEVAIPPGHVFFREVLEVGFPYPPPTLFLFLPLGHFSFDGAHYVWLAFLSATFLFAAVMTSRILSAGRTVGWNIAICLCLLAVWPPSRLNLAVEQTNWLLLGLLAGISVWRTGVLSGVAAAVALITKPLMIVTMAFLLLRRMWMSLAAGMLFVGLALVAVVASFGLDSVLDYVLDGPTNRIPEWLYAQPMNQSLLGVLLRHYAPAASDISSPVLFEPFLFWGFLVGTVTLISVLWPRVPARQLQLGTLVVAMLLLYPATLKHYSVLLLLPLLQLLAITPVTIGPRVFACAAFGLIAGLAAINPFAANLTCWLWICGAALGLLPPGRRPQGPVRAN